MLSLTAVLVAGLFAFAQDNAKPATAAPQAAPAPLKKLAIGDPAPALRYDAWIKGDKIEGITKGKVHIIEFWATWCGPCIQVMPHLTELQKKHPEVVVVSVAASEQGKDEASKIKKVQAFVTEKGDRMGYRVVYVGDRAKMAQPWLEAAGQGGIPCAFIVDKDGKIAWVGHPGAMDAPLEQILAGKWDTAAAQKQLEEERAASAIQEQVGLLMREAMNTGKFGPAIDGLKKLIAASPKSMAADYMKLTLVQLLAGPAGRPDEAWKYGEEVLASKPDDVMMMNQLAWTIVDPEGGVQQPNLDLALKAAEAAVKAAKGENPAVVDTLARVIFRKGDIARAIQLQKQALEKTPEGPMKTEMQKSLTEYERALK